MEYLLIAIVLLGAFVIPGSAQPAQKPRRGGRLVLAMIRDISTLNPFLRTASTDQAVRSLVYETLLDFDKDGKADLALVSASHNAIVMLRGNGQGGFALFSAAARGGS